MSRHLLILRHAHAEPAAAGGTDFDRPLTPLGRQEADAAGSWLREHEAMPDKVLASPARRARETAERVIAISGGAAIAFEPHIYEATPGALIGLLDDVADSGRTLLVGHNPGLEQLVALLTEGRSDEFRGMPPGALAWIKLPDQGPIEPGCGELKRFWSP